MSARGRGVRFTFHDDPPVVPANPLRLIWSGTSRKTRTGKVLGADQRVDTITAIRAVTIDGAHQYFEEDRKGSIEPGKLADLVILSKSLLDVAPEEILNIDVLETLKEGRTIYRRVLQN